jgi:hypothetical protein
VELIMYNSKRQALTSFVTLLILFSMLVTAIAPTFAQSDVTPDPEITEEATVAPEETQQPTPDPITPSPTSPAPITDPTATPVSAQPTPDPSIFTEDFQDGDVSDWMLSEGWALATEEANAYLSTTASGQTATVNGPLWEHVSFSAQVGVTSDNTAMIAVRVGAENYAVSIDYDGNTKLYRAQTLIAEGFATPVAVDPNAPVETGLKWYQANLAAQGGTINVAIDGQIQITYSDAAPLPAGMMSLLAALTIQAKSLLTISWRNNCPRRQL